MKAKWRTLVCGLSIVLLLLGVGLLYWHAIHSRISRLDDLRQEATTIQRRLENDHLIEQNAELRQKISKLFRKEVADVLHSVTDDLNDLDVKEQSITTAAAIHSGPFKRVPMSVAFKGSLASAFELMCRLYRDDQIVRLQRLQIIREPGAAINALSISMQMDTFATTSGEMP